jgi:hypothetical protein
MNSKKKIMIGGEKIVIGGGPNSAFEPVKTQRFDDIDEMFASEEPIKHKPDKTTVEIRNERKTALKQIKDLFRGNIGKVLPACCNK